MEVLVRIANEKYIDILKATISGAEAFKMLWNDYLEGKFCEFLMKILRKIGKI